jgi:pimeloyl-ACP methyl ester carboxylesterase
MHSAIAAAWWPPTYAVSASRERRKTPTGFKTIWATWTPFWTPFSPTSRSTCSGLPRTEPASAPERLGKWLDELKTPERLLPYATFADVAARLRRNNPRLPADKAEYLARQWAEQRDGEVQLLADPAHKRVNPVLYRVDEMLACFARICAPLLWVEGTGKEHERWWRGAYTKDEFYERLAHVPQVTKAQLEDAGHMLHHDQPEALAALLLTHLSADTRQS